MWRGGDAHVEHQRAGKTGQRRKIELCVLVQALLTRDQRHGGCGVTLRNRHAGVAAGGDRRRDPRYDLVGYPVLLQRSDFLRKSTKNRGVAAFQSDDSSSLASAVNQLAVDLVLRPDA